MADTNAESKKFSAEERAAMRERNKELKAQQNRAEALADVEAKIAEMSPADRRIAERVHAIVTEVAPQLAAKTWYGQPAYAKDGQIVVFFQASAKFGTRYCTLGFNEAAALDDGTMWPTAFALAGLTDDDEKRIAELVRRAAS